MFSKRQPTPIEKRIAMGNPGNRPIPDVKRSKEPVGDPFPDMSDEAKAKWYELAYEWRLLVRASHRQKLRAYCEAWDEMITAKRKLEEEGEDYLVHTASGVKINPLLSLIGNRRDYLRRLGQEFGDSPAAEARAWNIKTEDDLDDPAAGYC